MSGCSFDSMAPCLPSHVRPPQTRSITTPTSSPSTSVPIAQRSTQVCAAPPPAFQFPTSTSSSRLHHPSPPLRGRPSLPAVARAILRRAYADIVARPVQLHGPYTRMALFSGVVDLLASIFMFFFSCIKTCDII
ncbi:hypothetical protein B0H12DRAFT_785148 [Mycena haematopus]|nr:hypothetical protein B0H12DRAFT_785148 [Mycena haematopus]